MSWLTVEAPNLHQEAPPSQSPTRKDFMENGDMETDGMREQSSPKRRRIEASRSVHAEPSHNGHQDHESVDQRQAVNGNGGGQVPGEEAVQEPEGSGDDRVPFFKAAFADPDDKGENDCFFESCITRAGGTQDLLKHFRDKHGLIRSDQGRHEGGRRKLPKYLTLCPTDWPFTHNYSSSCKSCGDVGGLFNVLGQREHESPAICSFCWTYLPTRHDLVRHIYQRPCRSNEMFSGKLALIRHLYAETIRLPGADAISRAAAEQREAHAELERAARFERWRLEQQLQQQTQEQLRQLQASGGQCQPPTPQAPGHLHPVAHFPPDEHPSPNQQSLPPAQHHNPATAQPPAASPPAPVQAPAPDGNPSFITHASTITPTTTIAAAAAAAAAAPPPPPPPPLAVTGGTPMSVPVSGTGSTFPGPTAAAAADPALSSSSSATIAAMARSIERLTAVVSDLAAANARLMRDLWARDRQLAALRAEVERGGHGGGGGGGDGAGPTSPGGDGDGDADTDADDEVG
ncbi:hypothetical protein MYCTH_2299133 [Thermothelomyces thermophilus ATCC 42464]|uniref:Uncharacterized protein n=1 Tax=Thermothelomyces thermophilus (strain ATCC 42464 / BCRC 31852 / DSM 1799) TaxID=573729 RepID=G2Q4T5_THET4|nr:uncharacterized protein MYCTH_2299133 [Thermothelomyces thermophilus ATCC 42464]AEO55374.1 hypothetical protein MYCTH_2299133 [Thermothelomyces thermophilus ATCC 42464]